MNFQPDSCKFYKEGIYIDVTQNVRNNGEFYRIKKLFYVDKNQSQAVVNKFDLRNPTTALNDFWELENKYLKN